MAHVDSPECVDEVFGMRMHRARARREAQLEDTYTMVVEQNRALLLTQLRFLHSSILRERVYPRPGGTTVSVIRAAATRPDTKVSAATSHIAAGRPSASAVTPASSAPTA
jgi:hypothetical protein